MSTKKKVHHYIPVLYMQKWGSSQGGVNTYNLMEKKYYLAKGRNSVGAISKFNNFSFNPVVMKYLKSFFRKEIESNRMDCIVNIMISFLHLIDRDEYPHKESNIIEDFYEQLESSISKTLENLLSRGREAVATDEKLTENLVFFYCLQIFRTELLRDQLMRRPHSYHLDDLQLNDAEKEDVIKVISLINSLLMASDIIRLGCSIKLIHDIDESGFVVSDVPVILLRDQIERIEQHAGILPLSPKLLMWIDQIGDCRCVVYGGMKSHFVSSVNREMIRNANRFICFTSDVQLQEYLDSIDSIREEERLSDMRKYI